MESVQEKTRWKDVFSTKQSKQTIATPLATKLSLTLIGKLSVCMKPYGLVMMCEKKRKKKKAAVAAVPLMERQERKEVLVQVWPGIWDFFFNLNDAFIY